MAVEEVGTVDRAGVVQRKMADIRSEDGDQVQGVQLSMTIYEKVIDCFISFLDICIFNPLYLSQIDDVDWWNCSSIFASKVGYEKWCE